MNRKLSVHLSLCSIALLLFSGTTHAAIDLVHELTIKVPGLSSPIMQAKFGDVDGDGFPEVLVTDGDSVYLYSTTSASFLLVAPVDTSIYVPGDILFKDIDRDSLPDVVFEMWPKNAFAEPILLRGFSSRNYFSTVITKTFGPNIGFVGIGVPGRVVSGVLEAVDSDNDGYNELMFSYDSVVCYGCDFFLDHYFSVGDIFSFYSFPDSMAWSGHGVLTDMSYIESPNGSKATIADSYSYSQYLGHGPDWMRIESRLTEIGANGNIIRLPTTFDISCTGVDNTNNSVFETLASTGNIDIANSNPELLVQVNWHYFCGIPGIDEVDSSGRRLELYEYLAADSLIKIWSLDINGDNYSNFVYKPDIPGSFFSIRNKRVTQFMGSDGSAYQASGLVPAGKLSWEYPYGDDRLRLVALDGDSVSFYFLGIPTAVDDADNSPLPQTFTLNDPYPNPFNPSSIISFTLPERGRVTVSAYNVIGQRVSLLFDGVAPAGRTEIEWNAQSLPSGVYFIRASTETQTRTTKALLLK